MYGWEYTKVFNLTYNFSLKTKFVDQNEGNLFPEWTISKVTYTYAFSYRKNMTWNKEIYQHKIHNNSVCVVQDHVDLRLYSHCDSSG
jgi:hypothetical protein